MTSGLDFLQNMLGAPQQRQEYQDFVRRYDQGHPSEGYSDEETVNRYQQMSQHLSPDEYQQSAQDAFSRLSPQEREQFGRWLQTRAQQQNVNVPALGAGTDAGRFQDAGTL